MTRIAPPNYIEGYLKLASNIYQKHKSEGKNSPLHNLEDANWILEGDNIVRCKEKHEEAEALKLKMEQAYQERNRLLPSVKNIVKNRRNLLKAIYCNSEKRMGDWGFTVTQSGSKKAKSAIEV